MSEAKKILEMIESVAPDDTDTLNKINVMVWCYLNNVKYQTAFPAIIYTNSRDTLKAIRPEGWYVDVIPEGRYKYLKWTCQMTAAYSGGECRASFLPTEELAELHAIIQAIEWERENE